MANLCPLHSNEPALHSGYSCGILIWNTRICFSVVWSHANSPAFPHIRTERERRRWANPPLLMSRPSKTYMIFLAWVKPESLFQHRKPLALLPCSCSILSPLREVFVLENMIGRLHAEGRISIWILLTLPHVELSWAQPFHFTKNDSLWSLLLFLFSLAL